MESVSEGDDGAGVEEGSEDEETRIAVIADIARQRRNRERQNLLTAEDAKDAEESRVERYCGRSNQNETKAR